ncbi:hypothetical protein BDV39DRAFT_173725 [Aspergillus sergii]|uniref:Uncharacterized protein n=1 Tax=Aspergillus sergii TaxID=1034303 RepID=A0A5N6X6V6_9EURO|nr:hypothetical protein BDV39DRAFT_173725 [Aspergillus sergii]
MGMTGIWYSDLFLVNSWRWGSQINLNFILIIMVLLCALFRMGQIELMCGEGVGFDIQL